MHGPKEPTSSGGRFQQKVNRMFDPEEEEQDDDTDEEAEEDTEKRKKNPG
jgi:hypothetical protein